MKYSMNYYSNKDRKFSETIYNRPEISKPSNSNEQRNDNSNKPASNWNKLQFIVPWQLH
jgi:hypothetical protein